MSDVTSMLDALQSLRETFDRDLAAVDSPHALEQVRVRYLGRKSPLSTYMKQLGSLTPDDRAALGKALNQLKTDMDHALAQASQRVANAPAGAALDVTLPGRAIADGRLHPITLTMNAIVGCFVPMGFEVVEGPEMEQEFYNFDALNIPRDHPSREAFDTFFVDAPPPDPVRGRLVLRSHTSPVQIRVMQQRKPPLRVLAPGTVYRPDPLDASHSFMFHQVEGLVVDGRTNFADLKGVLAAFIEQFFGGSTTMRFRPHYFPFTEPSAEVDIACRACRGQGCSTCGHKGWLEILGCGMVHPNVFRAVGYDASRVQGFAFGMGVERLAMLKYGIRDIRLFFENDARFLEQF